LNLKTTFLLAILIALPFATRAQDGSLDTSFGVGGIATTLVGSYDLFNSSGGAYTVAIQNDGKIVVAGQSYNGLNYDFGVVRYNDNGSLDTTFGANGKVITNFGNDIPKSIAIQSDGKIVVAGSSYLNGSNISRFAALRYNENGSLDTSFDNDGMLITSFGPFSDAGTTLAIQNDGKLVMGGNSSLTQNGTEIFALARFNIDGSLDTSFDSEGKVTTLIGTFLNRLFSTILQGDGKILVSGYSNSLNDNAFTLVRYNIDGSLDTSFDSDGIVNSISDSSTYAGAYALALQNDGKIVATGKLNNSFAVVRYNNPSLATIPFENQSVTISIAPNPFSNQTTLQSNIPFENTSLLVYNSIGQLIKTINHINGQQITFSRDNLPNGLYFAHLMQDNKSIGIQKLVITE
jgi:uncharacterized delta-60 repeat protein